MDNLKSLDLYGLSSFVARARQFLTGDPSYWEAKHEQSDLVNFTSRGNVSLSEHGVCAHAGTKSGCTDDSYEDRRWLMTNVISRTGRISYSSKEWPSWRKMSDKLDDTFVVTEKEQNVRFDFDCKRRPDEATLATDNVQVEGQNHEIAHFRTSPYKDQAEFELYRRKRDSAICLRTEQEWRNYYRKVAREKAGSSAKPRSNEWSKLCSVIMGYRAGMWKIAGLDMQPDVASKIAWINEHNSTGHKYKESDWKNARRPERIKAMLPREEFEELLQELQAVV